MTTPLLYVDLFCGAGGTTTGVLESGCAEVVACVNHDENAIKSHAANHPDVLHFTEDIRTLDTKPMVDRMELVQASKPNAKRVLWASCECTNFSKAKGGQSRDADSRTLAEHLYRYIQDLDPSYIQIENVEEFLDWGPLIKKRDKKTGLPVLRFDKKLGRKDFVWVPDPAQKGKWFRAWRRCIMFQWWNRKKLDTPAYNCEWRILNAADFGARTSRRRLFVQFGKQGEPIVWPEPKYTPKNWKPARECLELDNVGESIFGRKRPICDKTLLRICEGIKKFCEKDDIFIQRFYSGTGHVKSVDEPMGTLTTIPHQYMTKVQFVTQVIGSTVVPPTSIDRPANTLVSKSHQYPTTCFLANYYSGGGQLGSIDAPCSSILTNPKQRIVRCQFLDQQYGMSKPISLDHPCPSMGTRLHHSTVTIANNLAPFIRVTDEEVVYEIYSDDTPAMVQLKQLMCEYGVGDISMRGLTINECLQIMGFPKNYKLIGTVVEQRKFIGNAVEVTIAKAITEALANAVKRKWQSKQ